MEKCGKCGLEKGHKMSCPTQKTTIVVPEFSNPEDIKHWGDKEKMLFDMLNTVINLDIIDNLNK
jgi:hypothetical protein